MPGRSSRYPAFAESTDNARTWRQTDVRLPRGGKPLDRYSYTGDYRDAVGPSHLQAIAMVDAPQDLPLYLRQLWRTDDEKTFRRVQLPWKQLASVAWRSGRTGRFSSPRRRVPASCARAASATQAGSGGYHPARPR